MWMQLKIPTMHWLRNIILIWIKGRMINLRKSKKHMKFSLMKIQKRNMIWVDLIVNNRINNRIKGRNRNIDIDLLLGMGNNSIMNKCTDNNKDNRNSREINHANNNITIINKNILKTIWKNFIEKHKNIRRIKRLLKHKWENINTGRLRVSICDRSNRIYMKNKKDRENMSNTIKKDLNNIKRYLIMFQNNLMMLRKIGQHSLNQYQMPSKP